MDGNSISTLSGIDFSAQTTLRQGRAAFERGGFSEAVGLFSLALISEPGNSDALAERAEAHFHLEQYQQAYDDATQALQFNPNNLTALFRRGTVLAMNGHWDESLSNLTHLLRLQPDHIEGRLRRFWVFVQLQQYHSADEDLRMVLIEIPDETPIQNLAIQYCLQTGQLEPAKTLLSRILDREPENIESLKLRGLVWRHQGVPDMAVWDFEKAIGIVEPTTGPSAELYVERAVSLIELGKRTLTKKPFAKAIEDLTKVLDELSDQLSRPGIVLNQRALAWECFAGRCWFDKSGYEKAASDYTEAIAKEPDFIDPVFNRASLHWKHGRVEETIDDLSRVIQLKPDHVDALHLRAEAFLKAKEPEKAEADFQAVDRFHESQAAKTDRMHAENREACDSMDCKHFCRK